MTGDLPPQHTSPPAPASDPSRPPAEFAIPGVPRHEYTDGRRLWDWKTKYPPEARAALTSEAWILCASLVVSLLLSGLFLSLAIQSFDLPLHWLAAPQTTTPASGQPPAIHVEFRLLMIFFVGCVGGSTFSIKWLIHSAATGKWHLDRRYWRLFVPLLGGVYACVILTLFEAGFIGASQPDKPRPVATVAAFAFLVGYFSDGVSGLLSNIANAVFGTLEKK